MRTSRLKLLTLAGLGYFIFTADSWMWPKSRSTVSKNSQYEFTAYPDEGSTTCNVSEIDSCYGVLKSISENEVLWRRVLPNRVSPVAAIVTDSGQVVTFDDWGNMGYGPNVIVVYSKNGEITNRYTLDQILTPDQVNNVEHSISSIWWRRSTWVEPGDSIVAIELNYSDSTRADTIRVRI